MKSGSTVIIGLGNRFRHDDGAGLMVAERLQQRSTGGVRIVSCDANPTAMLDDWDGAERVLIIDATASANEPGTVQRFDAHAAPLPAVFSAPSTHAFGVAGVLELARSLGRLPPRVIVYGIEGRDFTPGEGLSPPVEAAVEELVRALSMEPENEILTSDF